MTAFNICDEPFDGQVNILRFMSIHDDFVSIVCFDYCVLFYFQIIV